MKDCDCAKRIQELEEMVKDYRAIIALLQAQVQQQQIQIPVVEPIRIDPVIPFIQERPYIGDPPQPPPWTVTWYNVAD